ncbi:MAG: membrane protein of unknown function [Promethearchaeota archaeon]|nr:MAG: membrane protein of unknown function [Candidatus Lokiarchaeota archaeon]
MKDKIWLGIPSLFMMISGTLHLITGILAVGLVELCVTLFIFTGFFLPLSILLLIQLMQNTYKEKENVIMMSTTVSFLNLLMLITQLVINSPRDRDYIYPILVILVGINIINFSFLLSFKTRIAQMGFHEKVRYFCVVLIRGLGISLLFNVLTWIGWPPDPNIIMILYVLIFGSLYVLNGYYLFAMKKSKWVNLELLVVLLSSLILGILSYLSFSHPNLLISSTLFILLVPMIIYDAKT